MEQFCKDLKGVLGEGGRVATIKVRGQQSNVVVVGLKREEGGLPAMTKAQIIAAARTAGSEWLFDPGGLLEEVLWVGEEEGGGGQPSLFEHSLAAASSSCVDLNFFTKGSS